MYYVYFIFADYRVAIGRTKNLYCRLATYRRTHVEVFVLGLIECRSKKEAILTEKRMLKQFESCNAFRDMFYLTEEMRDWIVENTEPKGRGNDRVSQREYMREYMREYRINNPAFKERGREYQREYQRDKRLNNS